MRDRSSRARLYVIGISHLDTQWRWTIRDTISRHLPKTLEENFRRFEEFPGFVVNFDGSFRYRLIEEYYPEDFERLRRWVALGRWSIAGAWTEAADVNLPSPESLTRQALYGLAYFREKFAARPRDIFLPDCFGFGAALPTLAAHCGLATFSSQKLSRGRAARPLPFALGRWRGVDGSEVVAALDPGGYGETIESDWSVEPANQELVERQGASSGVPLAVRYFGVGDTGGAPGAGTLANLERALSGDGPIEVRTGPSDRWSEELAKADRQRLPMHQGELLMRTHGTGCYTSQAAMKRWNRANERLASTAEAVAVGARLLAATPYPGEVLRVAWERFLWHQFHDDLTGTSVPAAYRYSWNDELLSLNQFAELLRASVEAIAARLDTRTSGTALVVVNGTSLDRLDLVEAEVAGLSESEEGFVAVGPDGGAVDCQLARLPGGATRVVFPASVPGWCAAVYAILPSPRRAAEGLEISARHLATPELRVELDREGCLSRLFDGKAGREFLAQPVQLQLLANRSVKFPAWEIGYEDIAARPRETVRGPARVEVVERGPWRAALEIRREAGGSVFHERVSLAALGAQRGPQVETTMDWRSRSRLLKLAFTTALGDPRARYDLGFGVIERGVNSADQYEVPAQSWAHLEAGDAKAGLGVLSDSKHGWDRPGVQDLRLTLLHTPGVGRRFRHQGRQDLGRHRFRWALHAHAGGWRDGDLAAVGVRWTQPLLAFSTPRHPGPLGRSARWAQVSGRGVLASALKMAESGERCVIRLIETLGNPAAATVGVAGGPLGAAEINGAEEPLGDLALCDDRVAIELRAFQPRAIAFDARPLDGEGTALTVPLDLPFDRRATSAQGEVTDFDGRGRSIPAELFPATLRRGGTPFRLGPREAENCLDCAGQVLALPLGCRRIELLLTGLATATVEFRRGAESRTVSIPVWTGALGAWNQPIQRCPVAWNATHRHAHGGDEPYEFCYLFHASLVYAGEAGDLVLPRQPGVRLFAATAVVGESHRVEPAGVLYD
jgi:alpha-mannosidase